MRGKPVPVGPGNEATNETRGAACEDEMQVAPVVRSMVGQNSRARVAGSIIRSPSDFAKNGLSTVFLGVSRDEHGNAAFSIR